MTCSLDLPGRSALFLKKNGGVVLGERGGVWGELGGAEEGEIKVRM